MLYSEAVSEANLCVSCIVGKSSSLLKQLNNESFTRVLPVRVIRIKRSTVFPRFAQLREYVVQTLTVFLDDGFLRGLRARTLGR